MVSSRWSALMLFASVIFLHGLPSCVRSQHPEIETNIPADKRTKTKEILTTATSALSLFKEVIGKIDKDSVKSIMKGLANFVSMAPVIGTVISGIINTALAFTSQENRMLTEMKKGFREVNWKLDSLSVKISMLKTDVHWFNFIAALLRHEESILNSWEEFDELFLKPSGSHTFEESVELFKNFYENAQTVTSVDSLYRYLTIKDMSLGGNINNLLKKKFRCDIREIGKYSLYLNSLLWKGFALNEFYWKSINRKHSKVTRHARMMKEVFEIQKALVESCQDNYEEYLKGDVEEIARESGPDQKKAIAEKVKKHLDGKYSWYKWVVIVFERDDLENEKVFLYNPTNVIHVDNIIVAVTYTLQTDLLWWEKNRVKVTVDECFQSGKHCKLDCQHSWFPKNWGGDSTTIHVNLADYAKVTHGIYRDAAVEVYPKPDYQSSCVWDGERWQGYEYKISVYYSRQLGIGCDQCINKERCDRVLNSNDRRCDCKDGFYGDNCDVEVNNLLPDKIKKLIS